MLRKLRENHDKSSFHAFSATRKRFHLTYHLSLRKSPSYFERKLTLKNDVGVVFEILQFAYFDMLIISNISYDKNLFWGRVWIKIETPEFPLGSEHALIYFKATIRSFSFFLSFY